MGFSMLIDVRCTPKRVTVLGMPSATNAYDRVLYPSRAYLQTHPDRLAVMGILFGMDSPDVEHCRVLEIGCGEGGNLIPMAFGLPQSEFVGVDLATKPIERSRGVIDRVGLKNIHTVQMNLTDIGLEFGQFDYLIAHGIYTWIPASVQEKLLAVCKQNLSPNGVAFVSYNVNPGGHMRRILRDMMVFHTRGIEEFGKRVHEGKAFLQFVLDSMPASAPWRMAFQHEVEQMCMRSDNVVYHDELASDFCPAYFADFIERATDHGLQFLSEAKLAHMVEPQLDPEKLATLSELAGGDLIAYQQYLDFVRFRKFRQTLLCHREIRLGRDNLQDRLRHLLVASPLRLSVEQDNGVVEFSNDREARTIKTNSPITIAILRHLEKIWPRGERFGDLHLVVRSSVSEVPQGDVRDLSQAVLKLAASALLDLRTYQLPLAERVSERPTASSLARLEAQEGFVTTMMHTHIKIEDEQGKRFLQLLDGTRDRQALIDVVASDSPDVSRDIIATQVDSNLDRLYRMGLLLA
jgi:methyltransferase-like protein